MYRWTLASLSWQVTFFIHFFGLASVLSTSHKTTIHYYIMVYQHLRGNVATLSVGVLH